MWKSSSLRLERWRETVGRLHAQAARSRGSRHCCHSPGQARDPRARRRDARALRCAAWPPSPSPRGADACTGPRGRGKLFPAASASTLFIWQAPVRARVCVCVCVCTRALYLHVCPALQTCKGSWLKTPKAQGGRALHDTGAEGSGRRGQQQGEVCGEEASASQWWELGLMVTGQPPSLPQASKALIPPLSFCVEHIVKPPEELRFVRRPETSAS